jgi:hypothetical protein
MDDETLAAELKAIRELLADRLPERPVSEANAAADIRRGFDESEEDSQRRWREREERRKASQEDARREAEARRASQVARSRMDVQWERATGEVSEGVDEDDHRREQEEMRAHMRRMREGH